MMISLFYLVRKRLEVLSPLSPNMRMTDLVEELSMKY